MFLFNRIHVMPRWRGLSELSIMIFEGILKIFGHKHSVTSCTPCIPQILITRSFEYTYYLINCFRFHNVQSWNLVTKSMKWIILISSREKWIIQKILLNPFDSNDIYRFRFCWESSVHLNEWQSFIIDCTYWSISLFPKAFLWKSNLLSA